MSFTPSSTNSIMSDDQIPLDNPLLIKTEYIKESQTFKVNGSITVQNRRLESVTTRQSKFEQIRL